MKDARVVAQVSIAAPAADIFPYLINPARHFLWNPHLQSVNPLTPLKLDSEYETTSLLLGVKVRGQNRITKFSAARELEVENDAGTLHYRVNYRLQAGVKKTRLVCTTDVTSDSKAFAFTTPVLRLLARRELQSDLQALKIAVEQELI